MPEDGITQHANRPLPTFRFMLKIEEEEIAFREVSGLNPGYQNTSCKQGTSREFSSIKLPEMQKYRPITLKKGVFQKNSKCWDWLNQINLNVLDPKTATLRLQDEKGNTSMQWTLMNVWPKKVTLADLVSNSHVVTIESLELNYESFTLENL